MSNRESRVVPARFYSVILCLSIAILALGISISISPRTALTIRRLSSSTFIRRTSLTSKMSHSYSKDLQIAELAVQRATILTKQVFHEKSKGTQTKEDKSPVTIADFGAQALIISAIRHAFPQDEIVGEEEASNFAQNLELRDQTWSHVRATKLEDENAEAVLGGPIQSVEQMVEAIDAGNSSGGAKGRIWALDPVDGTKGFLRGGQYAVCLALIVDGDVKVGVLGCPNLPVDNSVLLTENIGKDQMDEEGKGVLFSAVSGQGAASRPLGRGDLLPSQSIHVKPVEDLSRAAFCESVEAAHSSHGEQAAIAKKLGITRPSVRMDSQAKYGSLARGAGDVYLRLPVSETYQEKIWDHAAGYLIVREAGGEVTDANGKKVDFSKGRTLVDNKGIVASPKAIHDRVIAAVIEVRGNK
jgi:3'(2'), 5'-bisphosphate nucleotidase